MKKALKVSVGIGLAGLGLTVATVPPASASTRVGGVIFCTTKFVEGVWIAAHNSSHAGWATISPTGNRSQTVNWSYTRLSSGESYRVHVGCGGRTTDWEVVTQSTVDTVGSHNFNCVDEFNEGTILFYKKCKVVG